MFSNAIDQAISGFFAATVSTALLHPLDLIKVRFQINELQTMSTYQTFMQIKSTGTSNLYRGLSANLAGGCASWTMYFLLYQKLKDRKRALTNTSELSPTDHLIASAQAGALTSCVSNPLWVIKTRMCATNSSDPKAFKGLFDGLYKTFVNEGVSGLYKGLVPGLFGVSHGAIQFMIYEEMKRGRDLGTLEYIFSAATSKILATITTYPYQVVRTRIQNEKSSGSKRIYAGVVSTIKVIAKNEGWRGFYKGLGPNLIRVLPGTCITFGVYETMAKILQNQK